MPFKVKATVIGFLGDVAKYPCHFQYNIGDEIIFDGEKCIGRVCPEFWPQLIDKVTPMHLMGPRYVDPNFYYPIWYTGLQSLENPEMKKYDGLGYTPIYEAPEEDRYSLGNLKPMNAFKWPPDPERTVNRDIIIRCDDLRTGCLMKLDAFDLADQGHDTPYFRRQMVIMAKVLSKQGTPLEKVLDEFSEQEKYNIYPPMSKELLIPLVEELELLNFVEIKNGKIFVTKKGEQRLQGFIASIPAEDKAALNL